MSAHTSGQWQFGETDCGHRIYVFDGIRKVYIAEMAGSPNHPQIAANARLIAAAPDMLATLRATRAALIAAGALVALAAVDIAIAKAEGRSDV